MDIYGPEGIHYGHKDYTIRDIEEAIENKSILEAKVVKCDKHNVLTLDLGNQLLGYIKLDELELANSCNKQAAVITKVGKVVKFVPISINNDEVQCSRKLAQQICFDNYTSKLVPGDIIKAKALKYETYGIFCDIGCGITALLPTGKIRVPYIVNPLKENKQIKELYVVVNKVHTDGKIELTHRELLGTWDEQVAELSKGEVRIGKVLSIRDYGYFILISQNLHGLAEPIDKDIEIGDTVSVKVIHIAKSNRKIKLQVIDKVDDQPVFKAYKYNKTSGHIDDWEYYTGSNKRTVFKHST